MIVFKKIQTPAYLELKQELINLYIQTFTKGISAQYISNDEANKYIDQLFKKGYGIFGFDNDQLVASLIAIPPSLDLELPQKLQTKYSDAQTLYIAEVLVSETHRGLGLGKQLFKEFEEDLSPQIKQILLRVWDENEVAINLYQKQGFEACGNILQLKQKPTTKETFEMQKTYMVKFYK